MSLGNENGCLAPRGASGLKFSEMSYNEGSGGLAPRGASGLKSIYRK